MKKCNKCKEIKELTKFHKASGNKDGLRNDCNVCKGKIDKIYKKKNKEKLKIYYKKYRLEKRKDPKYIKKEKERYQKWYTAEYYQKYQTDNKIVAERKKMDQKRRRSELRDGYIKQMLINNTDLSYNDIPNEMVELKREQIKLIRAIRND